MVVKQRCFYCSSPATLLCDYVFGWTEHGDRLQTCDMPTCRDHAEYRGWIHIKGVPGVGGFDSRDYCLEHCRQDDHRAGTATDDEAERLRRVVRAIAARRLMRERGALRSPPPSLEQGELF